LLLYFRIPLFITEFFHRFYQDDEMKKELDEMCEAMGMNISTFYMVYTKKALRERENSV